MPKFTTTEATARLYCGEWPSPGRVQAVLSPNQPARHGQVLGTMHNRSRPAMSLTLPRTRTRSPMPRRISPHPRKLCHTLLQPMSNATPNMHHLTEFTAPCQSTCSHTLPHLATSHPPRFARRRHFVPSFIKPCPVTWPIWLTPSSPHPEFRPTCFAIPCTHCQVSPVTHSIQPSPRHN